MSPAARTGLTSMTDTQPTQTTNLDRYGYAELPWSRPCDILAAGPLGHEQRCFLGTIRPDGRGMRRASVPCGSRAICTS